MYVTSIPGPHKPYESKRAGKYTTTTTTGIPGLRKPYESKQRDCHDKGLLISNGIPEPFNWGGSEFVSKLCHYDDFDHSTSTRTFHPYIVLLFFVLSPLANVGNL